MWYFWWGCKGNLKLIILRSERVNPQVTCWAFRRVIGTLFLLRVGHCPSFWPLPPRRFCSWPLVTSWPTSNAGGTARRSSIPVRILAALRALSHLTSRAALKETVPWSVWASSHLFGPIYRHDLSLGVHGAVTPFCPLWPFFSPFSRHEPNFGVRGTYDDKAWNCPVLPIENSFRSIFQAWSQSWRTWGMW